MSSAIAQAQPAWIKRITAAGFSIRKTFDGTKEEQNPASFIYNRERTAKDPEFSVIDVAAKLIEKDLLENTLSSLIIYPVVDYHRSSNTDGRVSKIGFTGKSEFRPFAVGKRPEGSHAIFLPLAPTFTFDGKVSRDWENDTDETRFGAQLFLSGPGKYLPGSHWTSSKDYYRGRYYVYVGSDRYRFLGGSQDTLLTTGYGRFWMEWLPFANDSSKYLQFTVDLTSRHRISQGDEFRKQLSDVTIGSTFYPVGQDVFGVGLEYSNGRDAAKRFRRREGLSLAFKLKL